MNVDLLNKIKKLVHDSCYRVKLYAVKHMIEDGFTEMDVVNAILGDSKIIEIYDEDNRCLVLGQFSWNNNLTSWIHVVCDHSNKKLIDIVTAYIPQKPWWVSPTRRGRPR